MQAFSHCLSLLLASTCFTLLSSYSLSVAMDYFTPSWMSQEVVGNINVHQMNERRTHVQMHNIYREPTHTHTHTHRRAHTDHHSLVSHNSTRHHGILHINWCCLAAIFTPLQPLRQIHYSLISHTWPFIKLGHVKQPHRAGFFFPLLTAKAFFFFSAVFFFHVNGYS